MRMTINRRDSLMVQRSSQQGKRSYMSLERDRQGKNRCSFWFCILLGLVLVLLEEGWMQRNLRLSPSLDDFTMEEPPVRQPAEPVLGNNVRYLHIPVLHHTPNNKVHSMLATTFDYNICTIQLPSLLLNVKESRRILREGTAKQNQTVQCDWLGVSMAGANGMDHENAFDDHASVVTFPNNNNWTTWVERWSHFGEVHIPCVLPVSNSCLGGAFNVDVNKSQSIDDGISNNNTHHSQENHLQLFQSLLENRQRKHKARLKCYQQDKARLYTRFIREGLLNRTNIVETSVLSAQSSLSASNPWEGSTTFFSKTETEDPCLSKLQADFTQFGTEYFPYYDFCYKCLGSKDDLFRDDNSNPSEQLSASSTTLTSKLDLPTSYRAWMHPSQPFGENRDALPNNQSVVTTTRLHTQHVASSKKRKKRLILKESHGGLTNQMICLQVAANLAVQYNRTLLVPRFGYAGSIHQTRKILFENLYNVGLAKDKIDFEIQHTNMASQCLPQSKIHIRPKQPQALAIDAHPHHDCVELVCSWCAVNLTTPSHVFSHALQQMFPYHDIFRTLAKRVLFSIQQRVAALTSTVPSSTFDHNSSFRLLSLHVRKGDRETYPLIDCPSHHNLDLSFLQRYPHQRWIDEKHVLCTATSESATPVTEIVRNGLTWERMLQHVFRCLNILHNNEPSYNGAIYTSQKVVAAPLGGCTSEDYDALFIATDDPSWVREQLNSQSPRVQQRVFLIDDFTFVRQAVYTATQKEHALAESGFGRDTKQQNRTSDDFSTDVEVLLVEQQIMALANVHIPSYPSSITEQVLRLRVERDTEITAVKSRDQQLLYHYYAHKEEQFRLQHNKALSMNTK